MEKVHRDRIQNNFNKLIEQISPQIEFVCSTLLHQHRIINGRMYEDIIEEQKGPRVRTRKLLELIFTRGPAAFSKLYETVLEAELYDAADTLMPEKKPHWKIEPDGAVAQSSVEVKVNTENQQKEKSETNLECFPGNHSQQNNVETEVTASQFHTLSAGGDHIDRVPASSAAPLKQQIHPGQHIKDAQRQSPSIKLPILNTQTLIKKPAVPSKDSLASFTESSVDEQTYVKEIESSSDEQTYVKELESSSDEQTYVKEIQSSLDEQTYVKQIDEQTNVKEVDSHIKEPMQPSVISQYLTLAHMDRKLPEIWPSEEVIKDLQVALVEDNSHMAQLFRDVHAKENQHVYSMKNKKRGNVLIIDIFLFKHFNMREGSNRDRDAMRILFESLGFNVEVHRNLTKEKMLNVMEEEGKKIETWHECFVLVILSHGCNGYIVCNDTLPVKDGERPENAIPVDDIREMFCQVKNLYMKPKLFFIQACRGDRKDKGLNIALDCQGVKQILMSEESDSGHIPTHSDCFTAMSVTAGIASWRRTDIGTWFIQAIAYIFSHYAKDFDIQDLMTLVNNLVARATTQEGFKQVSEQSHTFRKKFYFFPGLCQENH